MLVVGHSKESQVGDRNLITHAAFDPFYTRPVGLDYLAAAALQADAFLRRFGISDEELARLVCQQRAKAVRNPLANERTPLSLADVAASPMLADPLREAYVYPPSDGAVAMILASEDLRLPPDRQACVDYRIGFVDGQLLPGLPRFVRVGEFAGKPPACAYRMAKIGQPQTAFGVCELSDPYAHQLPLWAWQLGLTEDPKQWLAGDLARFNPSGGSRRARRKSLQRVGSHGRGRFCNCGTKPAIDRFRREAGVGSRHDGAGRTAALCRGVGKPRRR